MRLFRVGLLLSLLCCYVPAYPYSMRHVSMDEQSLYTSVFNVDKLVNEGDTLEAERHFRDQLT